MATATRIDADLIVTPNGIKVICPLCARLVTLECVGGMDLCVCGARVRLVLYAYAGKGKEDDEVKTD